MFERKLKLCTVGTCLDEKKYNWISSKIEVITGDGHHTFMVVDNTPGKEKIVESHMNIGGVNIQDLSKYENNTIVMLAEPMFLTPEQEVEVIERAKSKIGCKYDVTNIIGKLFKTGWDKSEKFICSELIAFAYYTTLKVLGKNPKEVTPNDWIRMVTYLDTFKWNKFLLSEWRAGIVK